MSAPACESAAALLAHLVGQGLSQVVLCPGSRSAPLAYAAAAAERDGHLRLQVRLDERVAAFAALGLALAAAPGELVAVVTTSGTAAANLHPAVLEAHYSQVPLLILTADRPHELRGVGASQTIDQVGMFAQAVRWSVDVPAPMTGSAPDLRTLAARAADAALGWRTGYPGPVHLNLAYREPLWPAVTVGAEPALAARTPVAIAGAAQRGPVEFGSPGCPEASGEAATGGEPAFSGDPSRTLIVAGAGAGWQAAALARAQGWPLLAEPTSGCADSDLAVRGYRAVLAAGEFGASPQQVVVFGRPTLSREIARLLAHAPALTVVSPGAAPWPDAAHNATRVLPGLGREWLAEPAAPQSSAFAARWLAASRAATAVLDRLLGEIDPHSPLSGHPMGPFALARAVTSARSAALVVGSSNPIRDVDLVGAPGCPVFANRGVAGIDGTVSTALGVAWQLADAVRPVRALIGDLAFLHDVGGLLSSVGEVRPHLQILVANDGGGSIFETLEHGTLAGSSRSARAQFERIFATPQRADMAALCAGYDVPHRIATSLADVVIELAEPGGIAVVEVPLTRHRRREAWQAIVAGVTAVIGAQGHRESLM